MAAAQMARESSDHTLQPTALVHEAYFRLAGPEQCSWENRAHFFAAAAEAMRRILVDHARRKLSAKRGGDVNRVPLTDDHVAETARPSELLSVDEALEHLLQADMQAAQVVKLRYFGGYSMEEIAQALGISDRTVYRDWAFARAWLRRRISDSDTGSDHV